MPWLLHQHLPLHLLLVSENANCVEQSIFHLHAESITDLISTDIISVAAPVAKAAEKPVEEEVDALDGG